MAQIQPSPPNPSHPNLNGQPGPSPPNHSQAPPISWEGDQMFNVYIQDYFIKRGFHRTAKELAIEADIGSDAYPPINARQGFLFEWWSVFWMFFSAKTTGQGPENVLLYFQWIQNQADRNRAADPSRAGLPGQPRTLHRVGPPPNPMLRPSGPMVNGVHMPPVGQSQPPMNAQGMPYPMPGLSGVPQQAPHQQPQAGPSQVGGIMDSHNPLNNVAPNPQRPPSQQQSTRPGTQQPLPPPSHPNAMPHLQPGQRPGPRSHAPGQFQSPTMAPAHPAGVPPHPSMAPPHMGMVPPGIQQNAPHMAQHPHIMRGPPQGQGGQQPNNSSPRGPSQTPTQGYQQPLMNPGGAIGPPPQGSGGSRSVTPATTNMMNHRSPSMSSLANESTSPGQTMNDDMNRRFQMPMQPRPPQQSMIPSQPQQSQGTPQQPSRPGTSQPINNTDFQRLELDLARIPPVFLASVKQEAGVPDRDYGTWTDEEKARVNEALKKIIANFNGTLTPGSRNPRPVMGQPQPMAGVMHPSQATPQLRQQQGPQTQNPNVMQRGQKRTSTSPGDEQADVTPKDQSPPDRKRQRPSPQVGMGQSNPLGGDINSNAGPQSQMAPMSGSPGHPPNHPGGAYPGPGAPHLANGFRTGQMGNGPMSNHPVQTGPHVNAMPMGSLTPSMGHAMPPPGGMAPMNPAMTNQHIHIHQMPGSQNPVLPQQPGAFRHPIAPVTHLHKMPGAMGGMSQGVAQDQTATGNRAQSQQSKPGSMMPPPSPGHRPDSINMPKSAGMMPPPQPTSGSSVNTGSAKDQHAPSPARLDPSTGSSPSMRPASRSGAGMAPQNPTQSSNSQNAPGNPPTPVLPGTAGSNNNNSSNALSPSVLSNRISPNAAIGSLSRPQASGSDGNSGGQTNNPNSTSITNGSPVPAPPPPSSAPPSASAPSLTDSIFTGFFDTMEDNFNLDELDIPSDFSQWIDMNPIN